MNDTERQLEEANWVIKNYLASANDFDGDMIKYGKKYLEPVDPLFEKFEEFMDYLHPNTPIKYESTFDIFKEMFKDDLNGTKGLDKAIDKMDELFDIAKGNPHNSYFLAVKGYLKNLKNELES